MVTNHDRKSFGSRPKKFEKLLRRLAPLMFFFHVQAFRVPLRGELPHIQIFMNDGPNSLTWDSQLLSYWFSQNLAVFQHYLVNLINNLQGGHWFGSSRTMRITGGKITTFKLGHPVFDSGIWWCIFPYCFCQNGINFLQCLALQEKKTWWQLTASVTRKDLQSGTWTDPSFQRHYRFRHTTSGSRSG